MIRQDYFERLIEQLAGAIARVVGLVAEGKYEDAARAIDGCYRALGVTPVMLGRLEPVTLVAMLGAGKAQAVAKVLDAEAGILRAQGKDAEAHAKNRDAETMRRAAGR